MVNQNSRDKKSKNRIKNITIVLVLLFGLGGIPLAFLAYQAKQSRISISEVFKRKTSSSQKTEFAEEAAKQNSGTKTDFLKYSLIGFEFTDQPQFSNLAVGDLNSDNLVDVVVCDTKANTISLIQQNPGGAFTEKVLMDNIIAPAHVQIRDFDNDSDLKLAMTVNSGIENHIDILNTRDKPIKRLSQVLN